MKKLLLSAAALLVALPCIYAATIAQWDFNSFPLDGDTDTGTNRPSVGFGAATLVGGTTGRYYGGDAHDPAATDNSGWSITQYPKAASNNLSAGVRFDVDTTGYEYIAITWYQQNSGTASRYARFQYTLDGINFNNADVIAVSAASAFSSKGVNLWAIPGAANNPAFGFRLVTEFESTATGSGTDAYVATTDGSTYSPSGNIRFDMVTVSGTPLPGGNTPPYVFSSIGNQTVRPGQSTGPLEFMVLDAESSAASLSLAALPSNPTVLSHTNITFGGSGANRTVTVRAGSQAGSSGVVVWVSDPGGQSNSLSFGVSVLPSNTAPFISSIGRTNTLLEVPTLPLAFTIGDAETPAGSLSVSGSSGNRTLVPNGNIAFGGSGTNRTVTVAPAAGESGVVPITVSVSDGTNMASSVFPVMVTPSAAVLFYEPFTYGDGSVVTNSGFLWANRSGLEGECQVSQDQLQVTASQSEDIAGPLVGAPYNVGNHTVLYAAFKVKFLTLPKVNPGFFAHFGYNTTFRARLYAGTSTNAARGCFRLLVANGSDACTELASDLQTNTTYTVVTRYDIDGAGTTLWLDPVGETDPGVTANDVASASRISAYDFRQDSTVGATLLVDDLRVGLSFAAVVPNGTVNPIRLGLERSGEKVILRWTNPAFGLQAAPSLTGGYTDIPGAASPFTNVITGPARFFRLRAN